MSDLVCPYPAGEDSETSALRAEWMARHRDLVGKRGHYGQRIIDVDRVDRPRVEARPNKKKRR